jgi:hypothetical protein
MQLTPITFIGLWPQAFVDHTDQNHNRWCSFIQEFEGKLNHWHQGLMGLLFSLVTTGIFIHMEGGPEKFVLLIISIEDILWLPIMGFLVFGIILGCIFGLMAWRMAWVGIYVWRLGRRFELAVQLGHPDTCGGLKPLGTLCLWNALIVTIPAILFGFWIIFPFDPDWTPIYQLLLLIPSSFGIVSFIIPLWSIHEKMVDRHNDTLEQRNKLSQNIDSLTKEVLENSVESFNLLTSNERQAKIEQINHMKDSYMQLQNSPVWPFDRALAKRFMVSQTIPILTTLGILSEKTPVFIESLFKFLEG